MSGLRTGTVDANSLAVESTVWTRKVWCRMDAAIWIAKWNQRGPSLRVGFFLVWLGKVLKREKYCIYISMFHPQKVKGKAAD